MRYLVTTPNEAEAISVEADSFNVNAGNSLEFLDLNGQPIRALNAGEWLQVTEDPER